MTSQSLWLGSARKPIRLLTIALGAALLAVWLWLIVGILFLGTETSMSDLLRPGDNVTVKILLWLALATVISAGIYFSDIPGTIEPDATGPLDIVSIVFSRIAMIGIVAVVLVMFYEVVARYVFEKPTLWANELSLWIAGFVFLLAGLYAMQQRSHIRIYVIYDMLPRWMRKTADVMTVLLISFFWFALLWGGFNEARDKILRMETFGTAWDPPIPSTIKLGILIIIGLVMLQAISNLIADWKNEPEKHSPMDDIDQSEIEIIRRSIGK